MVLSPRQTSPVTGNPVPEYYIHADSRHFRDTSGRTVLLRGINLASSAKTPKGQPGQQLAGFWQHAKDGQLSFVGRVLDIEDGSADIHLQRLRSWGFNCLRYVTTWESIEHQGPGKYDRDYIDYTVKLLRKCKEYGFRVYIDPHQDLWSRFAGGSGAPYWTLLACGLEPEHFTATNAAFIQCEWPESEGGPANYPDMIWATNYSRLACQTLFTLFFAGRDYAPKCVIDGVNIQDYLQDHYLAAYTELGRAIAAEGDLLDECVIGWDSFNEPNAGFLSVEDLAVYGKETVLRVGAMPTPFQGLRLGMGDKVDGIEHYKFGSLGPKKDGTVSVDPQGKRAWLDSMAEANGSPYGWTRGPDWELGKCIWAQHGVWDPETDELLIPDYFHVYRGAGSPSSRSTPAAERAVDFGADYWLPHWRRYAQTVRKFHPEAILFIHSPVFQVPPKIEGPEIAGRAAHSTHFYDGLTLVTKHWNWFNADALGILRGKYASVLLGVKVGEAAIRKCMRDQLGMLRQDGLDALGAFPSMMGEIGIPFDLDGKKAYRDGDYTAQTRALDASMNACDGENLFNYSIWTYCPDNSHEWSDLWNGEDLSVYSVDDAAKMLSVRASTSQLDLVGKIPKSRARATSKASSARSSVYSSRATTPNGSAARIPSTSNLSQSLSSITSTSLTAPSSFTDSPISSSSPLPLPLKSASPGPYQSINLNDGARALCAFVRPYPLKTVGTPIDLNFDIKSSVFTLTVRVDADDVADQNLPTEVYVPLVHYAAFPSRVSRQVQTDLKSQLDSVAEYPPSSLFGPEKDSPGTEGDPYGATLDLPDEGEDDPAALALKVKVTAGRWETEGQILRWYYPRPTSGSMTLKLEISRMNGAIPTWVAQAGARSSDSGYAGFADGTGGYGEWFFGNRLRHSIVIASAVAGALFLFIR
ncbi:glycoside hydrolase [Meredithblackwellia eburnea MCA 4105]